ncbi:MAG: histidinol-phosphatase [Nitrospirae bacterium]|nr:MAG: histidinol-phosphatase [Nitrospirota bacterium]
MIPYAAETVSTAQARVIAVGGGVSYNSVMVPPRNLAIAAEFHRVADELESQHANPFRVRAYRQAARLIARLPEDAGELARRGELTKLKGIGKDLAQKVVLFCEGGRIEAPADPSVEVPTALASWLQLPGFSPSLIRHLHDHLCIRSLDDLEALVRSRLLRTLPDFTGNDEHVLEGIRRLRAGAPSP